MSRIFLSHSSRNNAEALALRDWLASQGWNDVFLDIDPERGLVAADRWQKALRSAIGRCRAVIFLISPEWLNSDNCKSELDGAGYAGAEIVGVIIKDVPRDKIPSELSGERQIPRLFRGGTPVTFTVNPPPLRQPVTVTFPEEELRGLRAGLARLGLVGFDTESFVWPPPDEPDREPFRGLEALDVKDAGVFFGRDSDLVRAREALIDLRTKGGRKLFVIQGASGSGKSSFLRAGLLPRLEREDRDFFALPLIRPQTVALSGKLGLAASLEGAFKQLGQRRPLGDLLAALETNPDALPPLLNEIQVLAMQRLVGDAKPQVDRPPTLVLAIDQAEELFAIDAGQEAARIRQHVAAALLRGPDTIGLLTLRSDRFSLLQNDDQLKMLLETFNLPRVSAAVYRDAILRPATRTVPPVAIDPKLAEVLIADTAAEGADPLPLLAFTLERLYRRYGRTLHRMELAHYQALGGLAGSIDAAIAEAYAEPERVPAIPADRKELERLLEAAFIPALVDINQANGEPLSRSAAEREIPESSRNLVSRLVNARLLVSDEADAGADGKKTTTFRVAHEAVLRRWSWLRSLLEQKAGLLTMAHLVERQAKAWDDAKRGKDWLDLRGDRLREAVALVGRVEFRKRLEGLPVAYVGACRRAESAGTWKRRGGYAFVAVLLAGIGTATATYARWFPFADAMVYRIINARKDLSKPGELFRACSSCPEMVVIPPGSFVMGSPENEKDRDKTEGPQHKVTIAKPFAVSKFAVTFDEWDACFLAGVCKEKAGDEGWGRDNRPVIKVSWDDAHQYVKWIHDVTGQTYRLLSEAEFEYAARAGTTTAYSWGDEIGKGNANCDGCGSQWDNKQTAPSGSFKPNAFGLYDMHGNVYSWIEDCNHDSYAGAPGDGSAWTTACTEDGRRVLRGGSWYLGPQDLRSAGRDRNAAGGRSSGLGFRLARTLNP